MLRHPGRWAAALIAAGLVLRVAVLLAGLPPTNSDEATMGLMARHIATGTRWPVFFYGQEYMAPIEAYLVAPLFAVFGSSTALLRLPVLACYALLGWAVYRLTALTYSRRLALGCLVLLALGSDRVFKDQLIAAGGYPEIVPLAALLMLGAVLLTRGRPGASRYAAWGLGAGLALWDDWIVLPYLAAAGALLAAFRWRELLGRRGAGLLAGALLGAAPLLVLNLSGGTDSVRVLLELNRAGAEQAAGAGLGEHLWGGVVVGVPMAAGLCPPGRCGPAQYWWGPAYLILLVVAVVLAVRALRRGRTRAHRVRHAARLALTLAAAATLLSYLHSPAAVVTPVESARYLAVLVISLPAALWPVTAAASLARRAAGSRGTSRPGSRRIDRARRHAAAPVRLAAQAMIAGVAALAVLATVAALPAAAAAGRAERDQAALIAALDRAGVTALYSDYWTCNRLVFASRERISCAVVESDLHRGHDRYLPYRVAVDHAPAAAYAFRAGSPVQVAFAAHLTGAGAAIQPVPAGRYLLYQPGRPIAVPLNSS